MDGEDTNTMYLSLSSGLSLSKYSRKRADPPSSSYGSDISGIIKLLL